MIRKKFRRNFAILIASLLISTNFIGCTNGILSNSSNSESAIEQVNGKTFLGQVTSIDGSKKSFSSSRLSSLRSKNFQIQALH